MQDYFFFPISTTHAQKVATWIMKNNPLDLAKNTHEKVLMFFSHIGTYCKTQYALRIQKSAKLETSFSILI